MFFAVAIAAFIIIITTSKDHFLLFEILFDYPHFIKIYLYLSIPNSPTPSPQRCERGEGGKCPHIFGIFGALRISPLKAFWELFGF
jgi:hypothetical protein